MDTTTIPTPETAPKAPVASESPTPEPIKAESAPVQPETSDQGEPEKKPRQTASERISQIYAQKKAAEADAIIARQEAARLRQEVDELRKSATGDLSYEETEALRVRHAVKAERAEEKASAAEIAERRAAQARYAAFEARLDAARDRMPDFDSVVTGQTPISDVAADLIADSDVGPEIAYHLGKNPAEAARIAGLPPHLQGREIARIEQKVSVRPKRVTEAPPPVPQVAASSAPLAKDPASMSMAEYKAWYAARNKRA